jgi:uncharacterized protein YjbI with pentapeptide repeats
MRRPIAGTRVPITRVLLAALGVSGVLSVSMLAHPVPALAQSTPGTVINGCHIVSSPTRVHHTNCPSANLEGANLSNVNLAYAILTYAKLSRAQAQNTNLTGANLNYANLSGTNTNLSGAGLSFAHLGGANLSGADLSSANLYYAILDNAELGTAVTTGAIFANARWGYTTCPDGTDSHNNGGTCAGHGGGTPGQDTPGVINGCRIVANPTKDHHTVCPRVNLTGADLARYNLSYADFGNADLPNVDLFRTNLTNARLPDANLSGSDLGDTTLSRATLFRVNLSGTNLAYTNFSSATTMQVHNSPKPDITGAKWLHVICPDGGRVTDESCGYSAGWGKYPYPPPNP